MKKLLSVLALILAVTFTTQAYASTPESNEQSAVIKVTNDNYQALTKQHELLMLDFWAPWCPPCRALGPHIEALATEYAGKVAIGKCNVDENAELTNKFGISGIPAIFIIKNGKVVDQQVGYCEKEVLKAKIEKWR
ncbi:MAG: thioredoxin [Alistipes sp.]|nr:thioredoxin [Alistipes sp.]